MKIAILGKVKLEAEDKSRLEDIGTLSFHENGCWDDQSVVEAIGDSEIVISFLAPISEKVISLVKNLKFICLATTGVDCVNLAAAKKHNVTVVSCPGYATEAVAEHTIGLMLSAARLASGAEQDLKENTFVPTDYTGEELKDKLLGIIGWGKIGRRVGEIAEQAFNMKIMHIDKDCTAEDCKKLFETSDFISLHVPLIEETKNIIDKDQLSIMKDGVIIVNTARGGLINESALINALKSGKVFAAGLDVFSKEPPSKNSPLFSLHNVVLTPHLSFNTKEALKERSHIIVENILEFIKNN